MNGIQASGGNFVPADCDDAASVPIPNPYFEALSPEEVAARTIVYVEGNNPVLIVDENLTALSTPLGDLPKLRQTTENDRVSFGASALLGTVLNNDPNQVWGVSVPAPDGRILTADEIATLRSQLATANDLISSSVPDGWALFDLAGLYEEVVTTGITMDTYTMTSDYALV